jgi:hypothetical protein
VIGCASAAQRLGPPREVNYEQSDQNGDGRCDYLKSVNAKREIDLHPMVAAMLRDFVGERKSGLLFSTRTGRQLSLQGILKHSLHPILADLKQPKMGCHAFRRFRIVEPLNRMDRSWSR